MSRRVRRKVGDITTAESNEHADAKYMDQWMTKEVPYEHA